ncbi:abortive infection family protein [Methylosinus sp. Ce-a6]|uniref:abortive infection family protein n=1 Tax=Methylosinus sp. Ce-a6 TaxID=2172005 RepID=UPI0034D39E1E
MLGNRQSVVNHLGAIRNKIGDAHGRGRRPVKPKPRHAELAVNLAGTMASFLVSTWKERSDSSP